MRILSLGLMLLLMGCQSDNSTTQKIEENNTPQTFECDYRTPTNSLGIGLVQLVDYDNESIIKIYNDSSLNDLEIEWNYRSETNYYEQPFCAKFHEPDYSHLEFVCLEILENAYKIIVNNNDIRYLPKDEKYHFSTWEYYLKHSFGIRAATDENEKSTIVKQLYTKPDETSSIIALPNEPFQHFCVKEVKEDWVRAIYDCYYNRDLNEHEGLNCSAYIQKCDDVTIGWMKWKEGNKLLIDILLRP